MLRNGSITLKKQRAESTQHIRRTSGRRMERLVRVPVARTNTHSAKCLNEGRRLLSRRQDWWHRHLAGPGEDALHEGKHRFSWEVAIREEHVRKTFAADLSYMYSLDMTAYNDGMALVAPIAREFNAVMAFSVRTGGRSLPPLDSLNFSAAHGDTRENVQHNLEALAAGLGIDARLVATCRQVHGDAIEIVHAVPDSPPVADAIIATRPGIFPAVKTADCLSILVLDPIRLISAAIHAGWRGTVLRITRKVLDTLIQRFKADPRELKVGLGPAIGPCCYEVDDTVLKPFRQVVPEADRFITTVPRGPSRNPTGRVSTRLDLVGANRHELSLLGIPDENIFSANLCTACRPDLFFSHRRDSIPSGRHLAITGFRV